MKRIGLFLAVCSLATVVYANPTDPNVVAGTANFSENKAGTRLTVTTGSANTIINWADFSIAKGQTTNFKQPTIDSAVLNRVLGGNTSLIDGTLSSNGNVYLINPNGILIGTTGRINVNGFIASTLDISNEDFLNGGDMFFSGSSDATIENRGRISAKNGDVYLIAKEVINTSSSSITANNGTVGIAAANEVIIKPAETDHIYIRPGKDGSINQQGSISAMNVELLANGGNSYALAINTDGVVRARTVKNEGGRVKLFASKGNIAISKNITAPTSLSVETTGDVTIGSEKLNINVNGGKQATIKANTLTVGWNNNGTSQNTTLQAADLKIEANTLNINAPDNKKSGTTTVQGHNNLQVQVNGDLNLTSSKQIRSRVNLNTKNNKTATMDIYVEGDLNLDLNTDSNGKNSSRIYVGSSKAENSTVKVAGEINGTTPKQSYIYAEQVKVEPKPEVKPETKPEINIPAKKEEVKIAITSRTNLKKNEESSKDDSKQPAMGSDEMNSLIEKMDNAKTEKTISVSPSSSEPQDEAKKTDYRSSETQEGEGVLLRKSSFDLFNR